jgi:hypothetical protein
VNMASVRFGSPLSRTTRTASATSSPTPSPTPSGVTENATSTTRSSLVGTSHVGASHVGRADVRLSHVGSPTSGRPTSACPTSTYMISSCRHRDAPGSVRSWPRRRKISPDHQRSVPCSNHIFDITFVLFKHLKSRSSI